MKKDRHSEAGVACGQVTKLPPISCVIDEPCSRSKTGGSLHASLKPAHEVRDDEKMAFRFLQIIQNKH